ncbi:hypothetical protein F5Y02DRAFT_392755 [Annulohypoxylon stygium]|nr:hypothetical protein F5Y02DRAFT_392755 [Annulohypoxylon stygium]
MVQFEEYSVSAHYNTLLDLFEAADEFEKRQLEDLVDTQIGDLFVEHGVQSILGLTLTHRHFPLNDGEKLVNYGPVAYPWDMNTTTDEVALEIHPSSWRFAGPGTLAPYEFEYIAGPASPENPLDKPKIQEFLDRLGALFQEHNLTHLLGVQRLDTVVNTEPGLEFTAERANITLPLKAAGPDGANAIDALWIFDKEVPTAPTEARVAKTCRKQCIKRCQKQKSGHRKQHTGSSRHN